MNIAVNTRFVIDEKLEGYGYFIKEVVRLLAAEHPEHHFHLFYDRPVSAGSLSAKNITSHFITPAARHPLLWKYWFDVKLPRLLKKINADVFLSPDGFCSLHTKVPQCVVIHDLGFLHYPQGYKKLHLLYYKRFTPSFLKKAKAIATVSEFTKEDIASQYKISADKISVVYNGVKEILGPLNYDEQCGVKEKYTGGKEYFIHVGAIHPRKNLVNLLKAFSIFKKRLQSEMKLVLAGRLAWHNDEFLHLLKTYKYRNEVLLTGYLEEQELARLTASAYAAVYPSLFEGFGVPVAEAMKCGVPVLTSQSSAMEEIAGDAALLFNPADVQDMAEKMMRIYKDESLREQLVLRGKSVSEKYTWSRTSGLIWEALMKAAGSEGKG